MITPDDELHVLNEKVKSLTHRLDNQGETTKQQEGVIKGLEERMKQLVSVEDMGELQKEIDEKKDEISGVKNTLRQQQMDLEQVLKNFYHFTYA